MISIQPGISIIFSSITVLFTKKILVISDCSSRPFTLFSFLINNQLTLIISACLNKILALQSLIQYVFLKDIIAARGAS